MTDKDKAQYDAKATKDKERYEAEKRAYNVTSPPFPPYLCPIPTHWCRPSLAAMDSTLAHDRALGNRLKYLCYRRSPSPQLYYLR